MAEPVSSDRHAEVSSIRENDGVHIPFADSPEFQRLVMGATRSNSANRPGNLLTPTPISMLKPISKESKNSRHERVAGFVPVPKCEISSGKSTGSSTSKKELVATGKSITTREIVI